MSNRQGSARVILNEIDRSDVSSPEQLPIGIPAAVVGPARRGPAFVPKTFANIAQFNETFGSMSEVSKDSNSNLFGPLAMNEWLRSAQAGTYLRVLGVGDDAGFTVGRKVSHDSSDKLQNNPHATADRNESLLPGDTYFLGSFMKDTSNSTYLQDAGVTTESTSAVLTCTFKNEAQPKVDDTFKINFLDDSTPAVLQNETLTFKSSAGVNEPAIGATSLQTIFNLSEKINAIDEGVGGDDLISRVVRTRLSEQVISTAGEISLQDGGGNIQTLIKGAMYRVTTLAGVESFDLTNIGGLQQSVVGTEFVATVNTDQNYGAAHKVKLISDLTQASLEIRTAHESNFSASNSMSVEYNITNAETAGTENDITVQSDTASSVREFYWGLNGAVSAEFTISSPNELIGPANNTSLQFFGLKNDGVGGFTQPGVTYTFNDTEIEAGNGDENDRTDGVGNRYNVGGVGAVTIYSGGDIKQTLANLKAAIDRSDSSDDVSHNHRDLFVTSLSVDGLSLRVVSVNKGNDGNEVLQGNAENIILTGGAGERGSLQIDCATDQQTNKDGNLQDPKVIIVPTDESSVKGRMKNGRDADSVSFELTLDGQPNDGDTLEIQTINATDPAKVDKEIIQFSTSETNATIDIASGKATGAVEITGVAGNGNQIIIEDAAGDLLTITLDDGRQDNLAGAGTLTIGIDNGAAGQITLEEQAAAIAAAITTLSGTHLRGIDAAVDLQNPRKINLTQQITGESGNTEITGSAEGATATFTDFVGGIRTTFCRISSDVTRTVYNLQALLLATSVTENLTANLLLTNDQGAELDIVSGNTITWTQHTTDIAQKGIEAKLENKLSTTSTVTITNSEDLPVVGNFGTKKQNFEGGGGAATPIVRGVLMVPQGIMPSLRNSTFNTPDSNSPLAAAVSVDGTPKAFRFGNAGDDANLLGYELGDISSTQGFELLLNGFSNVSQKSKLTCSFDPESSNYFAKVLNTDPTRIEELGHYLYLNWDIDKASAIPSVDGILSPSGSSVSGTLGFLSKSSAGSYNDFNQRFKTAKSPWVISQNDLDLFKLHALDDGEVGNDRFRVLISDLRLGNSSSDYSTFSLALERFDSDPISGEVLAQWRNLSLDPDSRNYIARVIGDKHVYFDHDASTPERQRLVETGTYEVANKYVRVEMSPSIDAGGATTVTMPCGFRGLPYAPLTITESGDANGANKAVETTMFDSHQVLPLPYVKSVAKKSGSSFVADARLPWGVKFAKKSKSDTSPNELSEIRLNSSMSSWTKYLPGLTSDATADSHQNSKFSLNNIFLNLDGSSNPDWSTAQYRRDGESSSLTNQVNVGTMAKGKNVRYLKFRFLMYGGFDGLNIFDEQKSKLSSVAAFREANDEGNDSSSPKFTGTTIDSYRRAIDVLSDKSATEFQLLAVPGMREPLITDFALSACESRFDAMLLMDIEEVAEGATLPTTDSSLPNVTNTITRFRNRNLDSSFAAAYFPNVIIRRPSNGTPLEVPPSVSMLGVMSQNDFIADPWFAPAGLSRGRLNALNSKVQMNRDILDALYDEDINPIYEPAGRSGQVYAFGQKTLLQNQSALDRINVRRLLINVRRRVKQVANTLLFEPNRASTLTKFSALVEPIMAEVQARQGVERYKVQIDTSTTTQNDVENNTIRGKVYLQPTKSVEFISLDFVVTNSID